VSDVSDAEIMLLVVDPASPSPEDASTTAGAAA
jgi:hypothetical protein